MVLQRHLYLLYADVVDISRIGNNNYWKVKGNEMFLSIEYFKLPILQHFTPIKKKTKINISPLS